MKKTIILLIVAIGLISLMIKLFFAQKSNLTTPQISFREIAKEIIPSKTLKTYTDPSGFSFNFPDNLSLVNNEATASSTYADISLTSKDVDGGLNIKISDSKAFTPAQIAKEAKLGSLKAYEKEDNNKLLLAAFDQGILFSIETGKKGFWREVYNRVLADFAFAPPQSANSSSDDSVAFEGEEVVE